MRIALGIEYDGSRYAGWQFQKHTENTVQFELEKALSTVANETIEVICAGRTDAGVHGAEQVVHFDTEVQRTMRGWTYGSNVNLPDDICVLWATEVDESFHARFSAVARRYRYVIFNRNVRPTYLAYRTTWEYRPLDEKRMHTAGQYLIGEHDFSSYRTVACQAKSPVRRLKRLDVTRQGNFVFIDVEADGFLHHMVRNIAGVLMDIGAGKQEEIWAKEVLEHRDRNMGGVTAKPYGLYLNRITYPEQFDLPQLSRSTTVW